MYQRIRNILDLSQLHVGTLLIQYPLNGRATDELNLSAPDNFELYEVEALEADVIRLLQRPTIETQDPADGMEDGAAVSSIAHFIVKHTDTIVLEENWWHRND
jgi:hypothetical protein